MVILIDLYLVECELLLAIFICEFDLNFVFLLNASFLGSLHALGVLSSRSEGLTLNNKNHAIEELLYFNFSRRFWPTSRGNFEIICCDYFYQLFGMSWLQLNFIVI